MFANSRATLALAGALLLAPSWAMAEETATAEEVIQKAYEAAVYLAKNKEAGVEVFKTMENPFVWKSDGYVSVFDCNAGMFLANPARPEGTGQKLSTIADSSGVLLGQKFCDAARQPKGGWVEFRLPKPGDASPLRKVSFIRSVEGTSYQVTSGIYDDAAKIEDLQKLSDAKYAAVE
jgi:cytochrome c